MQKPDLLSISLGLLIFGSGLLVGLLGRRSLIACATVTLLGGVIVGIYWFNYPNPVPVAANVPLLSATAIPRGGPGLLLGNVAPTAGDKTSQWDVDIIVPDCPIARYDRSKPEDKQGDLQFTSGIQNAGQFHTRVGADTPVLFWIKPPSLEFFAESRPVVDVTLRGPDGQQFKLKLPFTILNFN